MYHIQIYSDSCSIFRIYHSLSSLSHISHLPSHISLTIAMALSSTCIDSPASVSQLVDSLTKLPASETHLYVDCKSSRYDEAISILLLLVHPQNHVYLIDLQSLGKTAFTLMGRGGETLRSILESATVRKVFFDVRRPSQLLYANFGVTLQGVFDIQLMEVASRSGPLLDARSVRKGIRFCIERDLLMAGPELQEWRSALHAAPTLTACSPHFYQDRPLKEETRAFCLLDLQYFPRLYNLYWDRLIKLGREQRVIDESRKSIQYSQSAHYREYRRVMASRPSQDYKTWRPDESFTIPPLRDPKVEELKSNKLKSYHPLIRYYRTDEQPIIQSEFPLIRFSPGTHSNISSLDSRARPDPKVKSLQTNGLLRNIKPRNQPMALSKDPVIGYHWRDDRTVKQSVFPLIKFQGFHSDISSFDSRARPYPKVKSLQNNGLLIFVKPRNQSTVPKDPFRRFYKSLPIVRLLARG